MDGSIVIAGAGVQWFRDRMNFFKKATETEKIIKSLKNNSDVYFVTAFKGLGDP
jgi:glycerol kinase